MARLSAGEAAFAGFRLIGRRPLSVLAWAGVYFLVALLPAGAITVALASARPTDASANELLALFRQLLGFTSVIAICVVYAAIFRAVLEPGRGAFGHLRLSWDEARQFLLYLSRLILMLLMLAVAILLWAGAMALARLLADPWRALMQLAGTGLIAGVFAWIWVRLSLAGPMTLAEHRFRLFESWRLTRGKAWKLAGLGILTFMLALGLELLLLVTLFGMAAFAVGAAKWTSADIQAWMAHPDPGAATAWLIGIGVVWAVASVLIQVVMIAPWAAAYRQLVQSPAAEAAPAAASGGAAHAYAPLGAGARVPPAWLTPILFLMFLGFGLGLETVALAASVAVSRVSGAQLMLSGSSAWLAELGLSLGLDIVFVAIALIWARAIEKRSLASTGLAKGPRPADLGWFMWGFAWAFALQLAVAILSAPPGAAASAVHAAIPGFAPGVLGQLPVILAIVLVFAFAEEVLFRGWLLSALTPRTGVVAALVISSALFAALHVLPWELGEPARLLSYLSYVAVGMGLGAVALAQGQIWSSTAVHAGYNAFLVFGAMAASGYTPHKVWDQLSQPTRGTADLGQAWPLVAVNATMALLLIVWWLARGRSKLPRSSSSAPDPVGGSRGPMHAEAAG